MPKPRLIFFIIISFITACSKTPEDMALVEEGRFIMGSDQGDVDERPAREVFLKTFYIDRFEATNEKYKRFIDAAKRNAPKDWITYGYKEEKRGHPVVFVNYEDAREYCAWAGKRLPTEEEWEKAARGTDGRIYPWGSEFERNRANTSLSGITGPTKAGRFETGKSPYGVHDMAGNVWEWTTTDYDDKSKVIRGGSWGLTHRFSRTFFRVGYPPDTKVNNIGFRCAKDG